MGSEVIKNKLCSRILLNQIMKYQQNGLQKIGAFRFGLTVTVTVAGHMLDMTNDKENTTMDGGELKSEIFEMFLEVKNLFSSVRMANDPPYVYGPHGIAKKEQLVDGDNEPTTTTALTR
jgi:hypothetical protein